MFKGKKTVLKDRKISEGLKKLLQCNFRLCQQLTNQ